MYELFCVEAEVFKSLTPIEEMYSSFKFISLALHALKTRGETKINLLISMYRDKKKNKRALWLDMVSDLIPLLKRQSA